MINFNIDDKSIKSMFQYFEAIDKKDDISISEIIKKQNLKKSGRKSIEFSLINSLKEKDMSDIAIYTALYLSKLTTNKWSMDDIENVLENENFIDETLIPMLSKNFIDTNNLDEDQIREIAKKVQENIVENEKKTILMVSDFINERKSDNTIFVHQLTQSQLSSIQNLIIETLQIFENVLEDYNISDFLNHEASETSLEQTYLFMNKLLGGNFESKTTSLLSEIKVVIDTLEDVKKTTKLNETGQKKVEKYLKLLNKAKDVFEKLSEKTIIWIQAENSITDIESLKNYFDQLEADRAKSIKVISQYKKLSKKQTQIPSENLEEDEEMSGSDWSHERLKKEIKEIARIIVKEKRISNLSAEELTKLSNELAESFINDKKNIGIKQYLRTSGHKDYVSEIASQFAIQLKSKNVTVGRPKGVVKK